LAQDVSKEYFRHAVPLLQPVSQTGLQSLAPAKIFLQINFKRCAFFDIFNPTAYNNGHEKSAHSGYVSYFNNCKSLEKA
jgi:hypothetical protein